MTFWKVVLLFFFSRDSWRIDHGPTDFGAHPKSFQPSSGKKGARGDKTVTTSPVIYGAQSKLRARVRIFNLRPFPPPSPLPLGHLPLRWRRYLSCQCALSSRIFTTPTKFHTHNVKPSPRVPAIIRRQRYYYYNY